MATKAISFFSSEREGESVFRVIAFTHTQAFTLLSILLHPLFRVFQYSREVFKEALLLH